MGSIPIKPFYFCKNILFPQLDKNIMAGQEEDEVLDILWSMITEEGYSKAIRNIDDDRILLMMKSTAAFQSLLDFGYNSVQAREVAKVQTNTEKDKQDIALCIERALIQSGNWKYVDVSASNIKPLSSVMQQNDSAKFIVLINAKQNFEF